MTALDAIDAVRPEDLPAVLGHVATRLAARLASAPTPQPDELLDAARQRL